MLWTKSKVVREKNRPLKIWIRNGRICIGSSDSSCSSSISVYIILAFRLFCFFKCEKKFATRKIVFVTVYFACINLERKKIVMLSRTRDPYIRIHTGTKIDASKIRATVELSYTHRSVINSGRWSHRANINSENSGKTATKSVNKWMFLLNWNWYSEEKKILNIRFHFRLNIFFVAIWLSA